ncbi:hypothetical protein DE146DRAFT_663753 [Phaeosphaeria sp. MPI-PUGE-AT-0046c]|nr:hypothetical protein DE146DRAFT_663753 [Phaeosphaeria sp. MPI-PUGE-AT-0046c]
MGRCNMRGPLRQLLPLSSFGRLSARLSPCRAMTVNRHLWYVPPFSRFPHWNKEREETNKQQAAVTTLHVPNTGLFVVVDDQRVCFVMAQPPNWANTVTLH